MRHFRKHLYIFLESQLVDCIGLPMVSPFGPFVTNPSQGSQLHFFQNYWFCWNSRSGVRGRSFLPSERQSIKQHARVCWIMLGTGSGILRKVLDLQGPILHYLTPVVPKGRVADELLVIGH